MAIRNTTSYWFVLGVLFVLFFNYLLAGFGLVFSGLLNFGLVWLRKRGVGQC